MGMYSDMENTHINDVSVKTPADVKKKNRELCKKYPFLIPRNAFSGKKITDCCGDDGECGYWPGTPEDHPDYDYEYTMLDDLPDGWRNAFGEDMCQEVQAEIDNSGLRDEVYAVQIKEKWGRMEMYMSCYPGQLFDIIERYGDLSEKTCIGCGEPATLMSTGWVSPWCEACAASVKGSYIPLDAE